MPLLVLTADPRRAPGAGWRSAAAPWMTFIAAARSSEEADEKAVTGVRTDWWDNWAS